jgi:NADH-quinone oxidoreductase subunit N
MAAAVKAAAFAAFIRVWIEALPEVVYRWHEAVWILAVLTMVVGNMIALAQHNIKRMLAYSSIAQAGYVLVAVAVGSALGASAFLFFLAAYTLATIGAFAVIVALGDNGETRLEIDDFAGLWYSRPWLALAMAVCMLSLLGFPVFGGLGFLAKWYMIEAALKAEYLGRAIPQVNLAVAIVLTSVVSAGYYLRVVTVMFMEPREASGGAAGDSGRPGRLTALVVGANVALLLALAVAPSVLVSWSGASAPPSAAHPLYQLPSAGLQGPQ